MYILNYAHKLTLTFLVIFYTQGALCQLLTDQDLDQRYSLDSLTKREIQLFYHRDQHYKPEKAKDLRNATELEITKKLQCQDPNFSVKNFYNLLRGEQLKKDQAYRNFLSLNNCEKCQAYSSSFALDEMQWDEESHQIREKMPYVWLSIEGSRFPVDPLTGKRGLRQGRDLMDDYYFDTPQYLLQKNGYTMRGRRRWQSWAPNEDPDLQRLLVAFKQTRGINPDTGEPVGIDPATGLKTARKVDDRTRLNQVITPNDGMGLVHDVMSGSARWTKRGAKRFKKLTGFLKKNCDLDKVANCISKTGLVCSEKELLEHVATDFCTPQPDAQSIGGMCSLTQPITDVDKLCDLRAPLESVAKLYQEFLKNNMLAETASYKDVLALEPKAFVRSLRGRYHLIEIPLQQLFNIYQSGKQQLSNLESELEEIQNHSIFSVNESKQIKQLLKKIKGVLNQKYLTPLIEEAFINQGIKDALVIKTLVPDSKLFPTEDLNDLKKRKIVADIFSQAFHEVAQEAKLYIIKVLATDQNMKLISQFQFWQGYSTKHQEDEDPDNLLRKTDYVALEAQYRRLKKSFGKKEVLKQYKDFRKRFKEFAKETETEFWLKKMDASDFKKLGKQLNLQRSLVQLRKIEAAGSAALGLWFDRARQFHVPQSRRVDESAKFDHLLIDTFDFTALFSKKAWDHLLPDEHEDNQHEPALETLMGVEVVNEVQIELGKEKPYVDRIKELKTLIADQINSAPPNSNKQKELAEQLRAVEMVFSKYLKAMEQVSELKGNFLIEKLKQISPTLCNKWVWKNAELSKGEIAIKLSKDEENLNVF